MEPSNKQIANTVNERSYGLDAVDNKKLYNKATAYINRVCSEYDLLAGDTRIFVVLQPDLQWVSDKKNTGLDVNAACGSFCDSEDNFTAFVIYLSEEQFTKMGWQSYALSIRHELAHVEANLRYGREIRDGDMEFELVCQWLDAPVSALDHEGLLQ